jgi:hypothetical protein
VRNYGTSDKKKFLDIFRYNQMVKNPETQEEYAKACKSFMLYLEKVIQNILK